MLRDLKTQKMPLSATPLTVLDETVFSDFSQLQKHLQNTKNTIGSTDLPVTSKYKSAAAKGFYNSRSSDSGKSSSCSPILQDCSFDSGIAGVLTNGNGMQLHRRIQQCQYILLALERDQEYFLTIRNRLSKITNRKEKEANGEEFFCNVCCTEINENDEKTFAKCNICNKYICRNITCAAWLPKAAAWECQLCRTSNDSMAQTSSWVADQITFNKEKIICPPRARSEVYIPISDYNDSLLHFESVSQGGVCSNNITAEQKFKIREYVEEVVAKLLGGNLDTVSVNQLSKSENYLPDANIKTNNGDTSQESASARASGYDFADIPENRLRQMIQKIIAETMSLPPLVNGPSTSEIALDTPTRTVDKKPLTNNDFDQRHRTEYYFEPTVYQSLLATAVLNKIVDKQLKSNQNALEQNTADGDDGLKDNPSLANPDRNFNFEKSSTSSGSSVEPRSDCSYPEVEEIFNNNDDKSSELLRNSDRDSITSDYLANHMIPLPDLTAIATESEEDDYTSVTSSAVGEGTWEKNWFLKKKKSALNASVTSSSIGMLVPDPKEDIRAQIGDKTADEVSDLSELGSDSDDSLNSLNSQLEPINDRLVNKHLIGGQNSKIILDELIERSSMAADTLPNNVKSLCTDTRNEYVISSKNRNEAINNIVNQQQSSANQKEEVLVPEDLNSISLAGSIAEREYKKWYNAVEMPNNPYAPEALRRRISGSKERFIDLPNISPTKDMNSLDLLNEPTLNAVENLKLENDYKRYSRDYYINSSLTAQEITQTRDVSELITQEHREETSSTQAETENNMYKATPAKVIEDSSSLIETSSTVSSEMQANITSASDDSDTIKICDSSKHNAAGANEPEGVGELAEIDAEGATALSGVKRSESSGNGITPTRGSTPVAFKFLQPKRKLLEPNQVLTIDEKEPEVSSTPLQKPVIEAEVIKALPSVKALARAFLMTTNSTQNEKLWLRKAKTLSQTGKKYPTSPKRSLDALSKPEPVKLEDDVTITSDLSSLETDSSSMGVEMASASDFSSPDPSRNDQSGSTVRGVLKGNIEFFENLKNK